MALPTPDSQRFKPPKRTERVDWTWGFLKPRHWGTWLQIGLLALIAQLPSRWQHRLGRVLGRLFLRVGGTRRHIAERNLELCFPELSEAERAALLRQTFESVGISLTETATAWFGHPERLRDRLDVQGLELLEAALADGRGVLLAGAHFTNLDLAGAMLSIVADIDVMYRIHDDRLMEYFIQRGRGSRYGAVVSRKDTRGAIRRLRAGRALWYAPDQDYGPHHSVFAPFFGVPAATLTATSRFARLGNASVLFISHFRGEVPGSCILRFQPVPGIPGDDDYQDACTLNRIIETEIRRHPDQYLWLHRRFKSRPPGAAADVY